MKGLDLSRRYYLQHKEYLEKRFPELMQRVAVGLVGPGSECLGFDDTYSRDHDWGPSFCLWMTDEDYSQYGKELHGVYLSLPQECEGFPGRVASKGEQGRVGAMPTSYFYRRYTGLDHPPENLKEWDIPASNLALCTSGDVFSDPLGEFSKWRDALQKYYPEDIRRKYIADCCMKAGQAGQYNWQRGIMRQDVYVVNQAKMQFVTEIMTLVFLLNKSYAPYFKWLYQGFSRLPLLGEELAPCLQEFMQSTIELEGGEKKWQSQQDITVKICDTVVQELRRQKLSDVEQPFLVDHVGAIVSGIQDREYASGLWGRQ